MGFFEDEIATRRHSRAVPAADYFQRRQFRFASDHADHPRHGALAK